MKWITTCGTFMEDLVADGTAPECWQRYWCRYVSVMITDIILGSRVLVAQKSQDEASSRYQELLNIKCQSDTVELNVPRGARLLVRVRKAGWRPFEATITAFEQRNELRCICVPDHIYNY